jgi:hypothetical protein
MNYQIEEKTLAALKAISEAGIEEVRLKTELGTYRRRFDELTGDVYWYLDITEAVDGGYRA